MFIEPRHLYLALLRLIFTVSFSGASTSISSDAAMYSLPSAPLDAASSIMKSIIQFFCFKRNLHLLLWLVFLFNTMRLLLKLDLIFSNINNNLFLKNPFQFASILLTLFQSKNQCFPPCFSYPSHNFPKFSVKFSDM